MANADKNIVITPERGSATLNPRIAFTGDGNDPITLTALTGTPGSLSFSGSAGQLFSITNNLTSGSIFSVNDVSGIPSIDVNANGTVSIAPFSGNTGFGTSSPTQKVDINGALRVRGGLYDGSNSIGSSTNILTSTGTATKWETVANAVSFTITTTAVSKTIADNEFCTVTAAGQTITLPATPTAGDRVIVGVKNFTNTIVARNGVNIMSLAENITIDIANTTLALIYVDATTGWSIIT